MVFLTLFWRQQTAVFIGVYKQGGTYLRFLVEDPPSYKKGIFLQGEMCRFKGVCCADFRIYSVRGDHHFKRPPGFATWGNTPLKNLTQKVSPEKYICIYYIRSFFVGSLPCPSFPPCPVVRFRLRPVSGSVLPFVSGFPLWWWSCWFHVIVFYQ